MLDQDWTRIDYDWRGSKRAILAYHVGGWRNGESPLAALARALGVGLDDLPPELMDQATERVELDELSAFLGTEWLDQPGLDIAESVSVLISLLSEKLAEVPPEVRAYFGAPQTLEPAQVRGPLFQAPGASVARA